MVRLLGESRSGFYAWLIRVPTKRAIRAERIEAKLAWFHGDSDEVSGSPRILADLRGDGEVISCKTVAKTMRKLHLVGVCPKGDPRAGVTSADGQDDPCADATADHADRGRRKRGLRWIRACAGFGLRCAVCRSGRKVYDLLRAARTRG
ncbi:MAG: IS3 family transposase [Dermatophilaceae bacterium]